MRAPIAMLALAAFSTASSLHAQPPARGPDSPPAPSGSADGFDHIDHHGRVVSRAIAPPPCSRCHKVATGGRLVGGPGHAACFGDCHGPAPRKSHRYELDDATRRVCRACHRPAQIARLERGARGSVTSSFPPYGSDRDFALTMSHAAHGRVARGCRACHGTPPEPGQPRARRPAAPHARCAACHDRTRRPGGVGIDSCSACHSSAVGPARAPRREPGAYPVRSRFSHRSHLARATERDPCRTCHAGAIAQSGDRVPTPKKENCRGCHDGKRAFSMVEPACRRCHGAPEREGASAPLLRSRFSHRAHVATRVGIDCATCHTLDRGGAPVTALRGHAPCSDAGCHDADFAAAAPTTCGVCHVRAEPWRDQHADPNPADSSEFGVDFSHRAHLSGSPAPLAASCARCHRPAPEGRFQPSAGHAACAGARCHAQKGGASPPLAECSRCHSLGLIARHELAQRQRRWSVRPRFTHQPHATEPLAPDRPVACTDCHAAALQSTSLADMAKPAKQTCARCHDGRAAFKLTGHTCGRCHITPPGPIRRATGSRSRTVPPSPRK